MQKSKKLHVKRLEQELVCLHATCLFFQRKADSAQIFTNKKEILCVLITGHESTENPSLRVSGVDPCPESLLGAKVAF